MKLAAEIGKPFTREDFAATFGRRNPEIIRQCVPDADDARVAELGLRKVPADLSGMKIRTPADPMTVDIFQALGASTQQLAFSELYIALQQGVVDGQENPLANIASAKIHEVNKYITLSGHKWESTPFLMSQISVRKVKPAELEIIKTAAKEAGALQRQLMIDTDAKLLEGYKANPNVVVNECDRAAFQVATAGVVDKWKAKPFGPFIDKLTSAAKG